MRVPLDFAFQQAKHMAVQRLRGRARFPTVCMLEPLYACNLACVGCATERHAGRVADRLPVDACLRAVSDCGAPTVAVCGGEPTLYPELPALLAGLMDAGRYVILCTNALLLDEALFGRVAPRRRLLINVHLDGMRETHDAVCARAGVFDRAIAMIRESKRRGYRTLTNTTVYKHTDVAEIEDLCALLTGLGVDGILISPGYHYEGLDADVFMVRAQIHEKFGRLRELSSRYKLTATPRYLDFAAGLGDLPCAPYSTVTFTPRGWKGPCYLIGDAYYPDFATFWSAVNWDYWTTRQDRRCANCTMHSGFEQSALDATLRSAREVLRLAAWHLGG
jgi:hopanoid biosynthesis associated radical SAM protein HpnH